MNKNIKIARDFAIKSYEDQLYNKDRSYIYHLDQVVDILEPYGEMSQIVGYLHDIIEDTNISLSDIVDNFGYNIATCVHLLTDEPGETRKDRKNTTYEKVMYSNMFDYKHISLIVKASDRLANALNGGPMLCTYREEHDMFKMVYFQPGLCDDIWIRLDNLLG